MECRFCAGILSSRTAESITACETTLDKPQATQNNGPALSLCLFQNRDQWSLVYKYKKSFLLNEGGYRDEKQVEQEAAYPIPISLYNCYRTVRHEKRYQEYI